MWKRPKDGSKERGWNWKSWKSWKSAGSESGNSELEMTLVGCTNDQAGSPKTAQCLSECEWSLTAVSSHGAWSARSFSTSRLICCHGYSVFLATTTPNTSKLVNSFPQKDSFVFDRPVAMVTPSKTRSFSHVDLLVAVYLSPQSHHTACQCVVTGARVTVAMFRHSTMTTLQCKQIRQNKFTRWCAVLHESRDPSGECGPLIGGGRSGGRATWPTPN